MGTKLRFNVDMSIRFPSTIVVPTEFEKSRIEPLLRAKTSIRVIGFGLLESAIGTADILRDAKIEHLTLVGIAGTFDPGRYPIGTAVEVNLAIVDGIGVGNHLDHTFQSGTELGWSTNAVVPITDGEITALSVAAASAGFQEADWRRKRFPTASIEDMETASVAGVCQRFSVSLRVIRGISNVVGDRNSDNWQIEKACQAVAEKLSVPLD